jgi:ABC-type nitrate/sulfonate/bicarbonate transport system permease component
VIYTIEAIRNLPPVYLDFAATLGAAKWQAFYTVVFPGIVPELVGGVRVVIATTWGIDVVAELMGAEFGVGRVFGVLAPMLAASTIIATILWVTAVAVTSDLVFLAISRRLTRWMPESVVSAV